MLGFMITTAFFGFIVYIIFRLYEDSKNRDYSIKNQVIKKQYYKESPKNTRDYRFSKMPGMETLRRHLHGIPKN